MGTTTEIIEIHVMNLGKNKSDIYFIDLLPLGDYHSGKFYAFTSALLDLAPYITHYPDKFQLEQKEDYTTYKMQYKNLSPIDTELLNNAVDKKLQIVRDFLPTINTSYFFSYSQDYTISPTSRIDVNFDYSNTPHWGTHNYTENISCNYAAFDGGWTTPSYDPGTNYGTRTRTITYISGIDFVISNFTVPTPALEQEDSFLGKKFIQLLINPSNTQSIDVPYHDTNVGPRTYLGPDAFRICIVERSEIRTPHSYSDTVNIYFTEEIPLSSHTTHSLQAMAYNE